MPRVCPICAGNRLVIRDSHFGAVTPKLGEAGTDDCPRCDDTGLDLAEADEPQELELEDA